MSRNPRTGRVSRSGVHKIARIIAAHEKDKTTPQVVKWWQKWSGM